MGLFLLFYWHATFRSACVFVCGSVGGYHNRKKQLRKYFHTTEMDTLMRTVTYAYKYTCIFTK